MNLPAELLHPPRLRFDASSTYATGDNPRQGIRRFGPYDTALFPKNEVRCAIVYPAQLEQLKETLKNGLLHGEGYFDGFAQWFRVPFAFQLEQAVSAETPQNLSRIAGQVAAEDLDLVFIVTSAKNEQVYSSCKTVLLGNGIPSQFVVGETLSNPQQRQWILENLALASYAKAGGTPWVVAEELSQNELILGVSRARDHTNRHIVGFVTLFTHDGDYLMLHSKAPVVEWERYVQGLQDLVEEAVEAYRNQKGEPNSIVVHFAKRPGYRELEAIEKALRSAGSTIPYALLHLNEHSNFRLFDTSDPTYVPEAGLQVELSGHESLLLLDGRVSGRRNRIGVPNVLDVALDRRSTMPATEFDRLVRQVFKLARVNWRGFNARSTPVTLNYSRLISRLVIEVGIGNWSPIIAAGKLRDKAWFL